MEPVAAAARQVRMRPVENRNKSDCGIAALCNVSGMEYSHVRRQFPRKTVRGGMLYSEIQDLGKSLGLEMRRIAHRRPKFKDFCRKHPSGKYVVIVACGGSDYHAVAVVEGLAINANGIMGRHVDAVWKVSQ